MKWDVTVIGGGLAGLVSAVWLARAGQSVLLVERSNQLGGRAATEEQAGCFFNRGAHALYNKGAGRKILEELGVVIDGGAAGTRLQFMHEGNLEVFPGSPLAFLTSRFFSWKEKKAFVRLMMQISNLKADESNHLSLADWACENVENEKVRKVFLALCRLATYCSQLDIASAGAVIRQFRRSLGGVTYLHGGWQSLIDQLRVKAVEAGVTIRVNHSVVEISGTYPDMVVAFANQQAVTTRHVISTADPKSTCRLVKHAAGTQLAALADALVPVKAACLDLALKRLPEPACVFVLDLDRPYYYSNHSSAARLTRDPAHAVIHLVKYLDAESEHEPVKNRAELEAFLTAIQPGWQKEVIGQQYLPAMTVSHGIVTARKLPWGNKGSAVADIPGLYVAGDWLTYDGMLADASLSSAKAAALSIMEKESGKEAVLT
ncbi:NAD(P)/FAD-dependent oxidoreductase [Brevibacillus sp. SYP-B805]|uniref:phytoene desaturase family protein n=1 Tax=Brevibacillus sp. SYP-B805 TaxID=1578199 RepID=UPI0013EDA22E|nr:FAD-dependent oxidoreductase [Brevibacillus sp. SYP-B805]NGQ97287.1 NAD(P)/FAD-dependent oxidoreductase [Brevibacillus sp. SYP-B805]